MGDTASRTEEDLLPEEVLPLREGLPEGGPSPAEAFGEEPSGTESQEGPEDWLEGTGQVTIEDIKTALPQQDYRTLTIGEEQNGIRCLTIAKLRTKADIQSTGHRYDEALPEVRLALLKMFVYELFAFVGEGQKAEAAYQDYSLIIRTSFGDIKARGDMAEGSGPAVAAMRAPAGWSRHGS